MDKDGVYHVAGVDEGQPVRVSEDFFIEARKANPPQIALVRPGAATTTRVPIEEVTRRGQGHRRIRAAATSTLHYSVNGGPETAVDLLQAEGREASRRVDHALAGGFQAGAGRSGQRLRHGQGRQRGSAHRHDVHPGRSVRARIFAIATGGRRRGRRRRRAAAIQPRRSRSARKKSSPRPSNSRATRTPRSSRQPKSPSCCRNRRPRCAIRPCRFPAACRRAS